jgi:hypothetical protein
MVATSEARAHVRGDEIENDGVVHVTTILCGATGAIVECQK